MRTEYQLPPTGRTFTNEIEIKRSRFIATAARAQSEGEARDFIDSLRSQFPDARHHCSAFYLHVDGANPIERSSDDGEPSGTAGKPMLEQVKGSGLLDVVVVVTRYFGGVKLGAGGLVHAYSEAVGAVLPTIPRVTRGLRELYTVDLPHAEAGRIESELRALDIRVSDVEYGEHATYTLSCAPGGRAAVDDALAALTKGQAGLREAGTAWIEL